jgi:hypothetical protein
MGIKSEISIHCDNLSRQKTGESETLNERGGERNGNVMEIQLKPV